MMSESAPAAELVPAPADSEPAWSLLKRVSFRFLFSYWILFGIGNVGGLFPRPFWSALGLFYPNAKGDASDPWPARALAWCGQMLSYPVNAWYWLWQSDFPSSATPATPDAASGSAWQGIVPWIATHFGPLQRLIESLPEDSRDPRPQFQSGSGDQLYQWLEIACFLVLAGFVTLLWSAISRRPRAHPRLAACLWIWLRLLLISTMLGYGFAKVFPSQFSTPSVSRLIQPVGECSPMGILWTFMGASIAYTIFAGASEVLGGVLLMFRRTTALGALVSVGVMTNVFVLNMCYDVPVKLYSFHYLAAAICLLLPDLSHLFSIFVLNRASNLCAHPLPFRARWFGRCVFVAKWALLASLLTSTITFARQSYKQVSAPPNDGINGLYVIDSFQRNGVEAPALITDHARWKRINLNVTFGVIGIRSLSDIGQRFNLSHNADAKSLTLTAMPGKATGPSGPTDAKVIQEAGPVILTYSTPEPGAIVIEGTVDGTPIRAAGTRLTESKFLLLNRGFHWVSQFPYNR